MKIVLCPLCNNDIPLNTLKEHLIHRHEYDDTSIPEMRRRLALVGVSIADYIIEEIEDDTNRPVVPN